MVLEEGMVFSYHPRRKVLPEVRTTGINENIAITADGVERLAEPWDLRWRVVK
jgi:Xaa-Pro aminopeptidase